MDLRPGYKRSEIGITPHDWEIRPLAGSVRILHGFAFQSRYFCNHGDYRLTTPGHFFESGGFRDVGDKQKFYDGPLPEGYLLAHHDLIVAMTEQADGLLGSAALIPEANVYLHNQRLGRVKIQSPILSKEYLYRVFNSKEFRDKVRETAAGTKVKHTSPAKLLEIPIAIPHTREEQDAIAAALGDADALIESLQSLIAKKRAIKQGAMQELLSGRRRLPGFSKSDQYKQTEVGTIPEDWECPSIDTIIDEISMGPFGSDIKTSNFISAGVPVLNGANVASVRLRDSCENFVSLAKAKSLKKAVAARGDVVVTHRGTIGQISYIPEDSLFDRYVVSQSQFRARFKNGVVLPAWIALYFHSATGARKLLEGKGHTGVPAIAAPTTTFRKLSVPLPSFPEQQAIADVLFTLDTLISSLEDRLNKARQIKQGMMQELLTGRIRLV